MSRSILFGTLMREIDLMVDARPVVGYVLRDMARDTHQRKATFALLRLSTQGFFDSVDVLGHSIRTLKDELESAGALYLDVAEEMERVPEWTTRFYLNDVGGHLSLEGNQFLARYIEKHILNGRRNRSF
jgi:hypothetical protein